MSGEIENEGSGLLTVDGERLVYSRAKEIVWSLHLGAVKLIGEHTNDHGPYLDDYYILFAAESPVVYYSAPMYANPSIMESLSEFFGAELEFGLCNRTDFASRVIWPPHLADRSLFNFAPLSRGERLRDRLKDWVLPLIDRELTPEICQHLADNTSDGAAV